MPHLQEVKYVMGFQALKLKGYKTPFLISVHILCMQCTVAILKEVHGMRLIDRLWAASVNCVVNWTIINFI